jgi:outer membrane protein W
MVIMKFFSFLVTLLLPFGLQGFYCITDIETDWTLEVRGAYYQPSDKKIDKYYSNHWIDYELETSYRVNPFWDVWAGLSWARKHTRFRLHEDGLKNGSKIFVLPLAIGAKFSYPILPYAQIYTGVGLCYSFLKIQNKCMEHDSDVSFHRSPFKRNLLKSDWGGVIKLGVRVALSKSTFIDVFTDYYAQTFKLSHHETASKRVLFRHDIDVSGFKFGGGIGVYF